MQVCLLRRYLMLQTVLRIFDVWNLPDIFGLRKNAVFPLNFQKFHIYCKVVVWFSLIFGCKFVYFLYIRKESIMVSEQTMLYCPVELKFFSGLLRPKQRNDQYFYVCDSVMVWFCDRFVCVTLVVSSSLHLNIFQAAPNSVQIFFNAISRDVFFSNF